MSDADGLLPAHRARPEIRCGCGAALAFCPDCCRWFHKAAGTYKCGEDAHVCGMAAPDTPQEAAAVPDTARLLSRARWSRPASSRAQVRGI